MLLMGDEVRRSQRGNNNAYCQNNETSWFDWTALEHEQDLLRFTQGLIQLIQGLKVFRLDHLLRVTSSWHHEPHLVWHGCHLGQPDWSDHSHTLAFTLRYPDAGEQLHVILNAYSQPLSFAIPSLDRHEAWHRIVDTARDAPEDFYDPEHSPPVGEPAYTASGHSVVVLISRGQG
jgi:glycogen operon protein